MAAPREVAAFFENLPRKGLSPEERKVLRAIENLSDAVQELGLPSGVRLEEWAQKRVPPDAVDIVNASGVLWIPKPERPRAVPKPAQRSEETKKFMDSLPQEEFLKEEEKLRNCVCRFLLDSSRPQNIEDVERNSMVKRARDALLPQTVGLLDWIKERIGEEIQFIHADHGILRIKLAPDFDKSTIDDESEEEEEDPRSKNGELWLESLPLQKLLPAELKLRKAVLGLIAQSGNRPPPLAVATRDPDVRQCLDALEFPRDLTLANWIDHRIGGEVEIRKDERGRNEVLVNINDDKEEEIGADEYQGGEGENIEQFIEEARVDIKAAEALRQAEPHVQALVVQRGLDSLKKGKNRSAMLMAWMRVFRDRNPDTVFKGGRKDDSRSRDQARDAQPDLSRGDRQGRSREVRDRGEMAPAKSHPAKSAPALKLAPAGHLRSRSLSPRNGRRPAELDLRRPESRPRVRRDSRPRGGRRSPKGGGRGKSSWHDSVPDQSMQFMRDKIDRFVRENGLDGRAEDALAGASEEVQQYVIDGGSLSTAINPSAACLARIRKASLPATKRQRMG